jgi:CheY-like chemotaxis protein
MPGLLLLDLNLRGGSGLDVLKWVRSRPELCMVMIVAMTSSENPLRAQQAYQLGANSFLIKPFGTEVTNAMVRGLHHYWFTMNWT